VQAPGDQRDGGCSRRDQKKKKKKKKIVFSKAERRYEKYSILRYRYLGRNIDSRLRRGEGKNWGVKGEH